METRKKEEITNFGDTAFFILNEMKRVQFNVKHSVLNVLIFIVDVICFKRCFIITVIYFLAHFVILTLPCGWSVCLCLGLTLDAGVQAEVFRLAEVHPLQAATLLLRHPRWRPGEQRSSRRRHRLQL